MEKKWYWVHVPVSIPVRVIAEDQDKAIAKGEAIVEFALKDARDRSEVFSDAIVLEGNTAAEEE